jgi:hypothetical protein
MVCYLFIQRHSKGEEEKKKSFLKSQIYILKKGPRNDNYNGLILRENASFYPDLSPEQQKKTSELNSKVCIDGLLGIFCYLFPQLSYGILKRIKIK